MATRRAVANGNWSATSTWNGGVVPGNGDTVYANGFNVTLDQDITIGGDNNPTVSAGSFVAGQWYEITFVGTTSWTGIGAASNTAGTVFLATGVGSGTGEAKALATLTTTNNTAAGAAAGGSFVMSTVRAINTDIRAGTTTCLNVSATTGTLALPGIRILGGISSAAHAIVTTANIELQEGCLLTGGSNAAFALNNNSTGTITISGSCTFAAGGVNAHALSNSSTGAIAINSSCSFTGGSNAAFALNNNSTGTITVNSPCTFTGGTTAAFALNNASAGTITVNSPCTFTGGNGSAAFSNVSAGSVTVTNGTFTASALSNAINIANTSANVSLSGDFLDHWSGWKAVNGGRWRLGTTPSAARTRYALAGTTDSYVEMFTADNTGFGLPAATDVRSGISYGGGAVTGTCAVPAAGSVALGVAVDNTTGTAILTGDAVAASVWSAATRTITEGGITAADVWSHATRTITGGTVDTLTNAPTVPSAASIASQVRTELGPELTKVSALNTERLANVPTVNILGTLLAQANS